MYTSTGFKNTLHKPNASKTGLITAIYYLGTWVSYVFLSHPASDYLGRRYAAWIGMLVSCFGAALQTGATSRSGYAMFIVGRIFCGLGIALVSTAVPMYQRSVFDSCGVDKTDVLFLVRLPRLDKEEDTS